ncbi:MAG: hypothetical protein H6584_06315 [Flavobacteriales bacterium]|nr:hypothetical protein [Flavobacteriales bacterium]
MTTDALLEVNDFVLRYDGIFRIKFDHEGHHLEKKTFLSPDMLFTIIQNEGISNSLESLDFYDGVRFTKSTLIYEVFYEKDGSISFLTDELADELYDKHRLVLIYCKFKKE